MCLLTAYLHIRKRLFSFLSFAYATTGRAYGNFLYLHTHTHTHRNVLLVAYGYSVLTTPLQTPSLSPVASCTSAIVIAGFQDTVTVSG